MRIPAAVAAPPSRFLAGLRKRVETTSIVAPERGVTLVTTACGRSDGIPSSGCGLMSLENWYREEEVDGERSCCRFMAPTLSMCKSL